LQSKSCGGSSERRDRRSSSERRDRRNSSERRDRRTSSERKDSGHEKEVTRSKGRESGKKDSSASDRSSAEPSEKQLNDKGKFQVAIGGVKKEPPRKVTADEAAAIVMAATRGLGSVDPQSNTLKDRSGISGIKDPGAVSKPVSYSEAGTSLTSSGQPKTEGTGIIDDDWIANTIAKAVAVAASKEADSSEASMTNEQKLKAERLRRARMFTAIIKTGGNKSNLVTSDPVSESAKASPADFDPDNEPLATEREGSSAPFEREGSNMLKQEKDSDDEQSRARKYRKHHPGSDEDKDDLDESYRHSRKRHRSERSRGHNKDAHKHKHREHSKDREYRHQTHSHSSSEDERRSSKSRHQHRHDLDYTEDEHRSSRRHQRNHGSGSKRKHKDDRDPNEQTRGRAEASQSTPEHKYGSKQPPGDTAQSSHASTEVPDELKAKIRAMLLETL
jgi:hypothetical protein